MFKIVETLGKGKPQLRVIPESWETNSVLYWPTSNADEFVKDSKSTPEASWFQMPCTLRRSKLANLETAEYELEKMLRYHDTGDPNAVTEIPVISKTKRVRVLLPKGTNVEPALCTTPNSVAESCMEVVSPAASTCGNSNSQAAIPVSSQIKTISLNESDSEQMSEIASVVITADGSQQTFETRAIMHTINGHIPQLSYIPHQSTPMNSHQSNESFLQHNMNQFNLTTTSESTKDPLVVQDIFQVPIIDTNDNYGKVLKNQETMLQNQTVILNQLAGFGAMFENIAIRLDKIENNCKVEHIAHKHAEVDLKDFKPIDSLQDLAALDEKLKTEAYMELLLEKLSFVCGKTGNENGVNASYTLVDKLFTRTFMTECSWAGGSRGGKEKVPFKIYKNVINLFFNLVCLADNRFTLENCESFFKNVLKNSTRRSEVKKTASRSSKCKRRPSKLSYRIKKREEMIEKTANVSDNEKDKENISANNSDLENNDESEIVIIKIGSDQDVPE